MHIHHTLLPSPYAFLTPSFRSLCSHRQCYFNSHFICTNMIYVLIQDVGPINEKKKHGVFLFEMDQNHLMRLSPFASIFLHVGVCACVCVICEHWCLHLVGTHVCLGGHPCLCTWRPEISTASPLQLLCTLYVEVGSLG